MASIAFFTNAGITAFNTAQSTNEQVLIEQIRIASESTADETTTVLTALYECNIQDIIKSVDGMSFTIKSIIAKNTFTSTARSSPVILQTISPAAKGLALKRGMTCWH